jgi:hypothetical protein
MEPPPIFAWAGWSDTACAPAAAETFPTATRAIAGIQLFFVIFQKQMPARLRTIFGDFGRPSNILQRRPSEASAFP